MAKTSENMPAVVAISGNHAFLRDRDLKDLLSCLEKEGRTTDYVDASLKGSFTEATSGGLFADPCQVVVEHPQDVPFDTLKAHLERGDKEIIIILYTPKKIRKNTKYAKWLDVNIKVHLQHELQDPWKMETQAQAFVMKEASRYGSVLDEHIAKALVSRVGFSSFGMLSYEIMKMDILAKARGSKQIEIVDLAGGMAQIGGATLTPLFNALEVKDPKQVARALLKIQALSSTDPTMWIIPALGPTVVKWLCAVGLSEKGVPHGEAASRLGMNPWFYQNKFLPAAKLMGTVFLKDLVSALAKSHRSVLSGDLDPWSGLTSRLLMTCT
jgi:DNA polymerase III delta subunit